MTRSAAALLLCWAGGLAAQIPDPISADALRAHVTFLSSDLLEGRDTPSRGLDIAAQYIATQLRLIGVEPASPDGYFQNIDTGPSAQNVAGVLTGSDALLRDEYVVVSAHYDHLGRRGNRILNGANDNASGTASVLETARALVNLNSRPKRSVLFLFYCGEEEGLLGSQFYAAHPLVPLIQTIAQLNLEQMGRTDGVKLRTANLTGWNLSSLTKTLVEAGHETGIRITNSSDSNRYFAGSDNIPLARLGVPAHTISVTYQFPDYHKAGDVWRKINYDNMAQVDRAVALTILKLASSPERPAWSAGAKPYADAAKKLNAPRPAPSQSRP